MNKYSEIGKEDMFNIKKGCTNCIWYKKTNYSMYGSLSGYVENECRNPKNLNKDNPFIFRTKENCKYYKLSFYRFLRQLIQKKR